MKHEYVAGEAYAMAGVTTRHNLITLNIARQLHTAARGRRCRVFATDVRLRAAEDRFYYPDLIVACGIAGDVELVVEEPCLVVEVTSPASRAIDRREKCTVYQQIGSLRGYLIVDQRRRHVLAYTREPAGEWMRGEYEADGEIRIPCPDSALTLDQIYEDIAMPVLSVREGEWDEWGGWEPDAR
jgi:Uma2 family endonuclease